MANIGAGYVEVSKAISPYGKIAPHVGTPRAQEEHQQLAYSFKTEYAAQNFGRFFFEQRGIVSHCQLTIYFTRDGEGSGR